MEGLPNCFSPLHLDLSCGARYLALAAARSLHMKYTNTVLSTPGENLLRFCGLFLPVSFSCPPSGACNGCECECVSMSVSVNVHVSVYLCVSVEMFSRVCDVLFLPSSSCPPSGA